MNALLLTVAGVILGLVATLTEALWLAVLAAAIALAGAYVQYSAGLPFEYKFTAADWQREGVEYSILIPKRVHNKTNPTATVFEGIAPNFQEVVVAIKISLDCAVVIEATVAFQGKVVVK